MSPDQINIAIAEYCGWEDIRNGISFIIGTAPDGRISIGIPDYYHDLNAMHEAEKSFRLHEDIDGQYTYGDILRGMAGCVGPRGGHFLPNGWGIFYIAHLTAAQRAEAFLRTVGKWEGSKNEP